VVFTIAGTCRRPRSRRAAWHVVLQQTEYSSGFSAVKWTPGPGRTPGLSTVAVERFFKEEAGSAGVGAHRDNVNGSLCAGLALAATV
jgi:hypothetical protein